MRFSAPLGLLALCADGATNGDIPSWCSREIVHSQLELLFGSASEEEIVAATADCVKVFSGVHVEKPLTSPENAYVDEEPLVPVIDVEAAMKALEEVTKNSEWNMADYTGIHPGWQSHEHPHKTYGLYYPTSTTTRQTQIITQTATTPCPPQPLIQATAFAVPVGTLPLPSSTPLPIDGGSGRHAAFDHQAHGHKSVHSADAEIEWSGHTSVFVAPNFSTVAPTSTSSGRVTQIVPPTTVQTVGPASTAFLQPVGTLSTQPTSPYLVEPVYPGHRAFDHQVSAHDLKHIHSEDGLVVPPTAETEPREFAKRLEDPLVVPPVIEELGYSLAASADRLARLAAELPILRDYIDRRDIRFPKFDQASSTTTAAPTLSAQISTTTLSPSGAAIAPIIITPMIPKVMQPIVVPRYDAMHSGPENSDAQDLYEPLRDVLRRGAMPVQLMPVASSKRVTTPIQRIITSTERTVRQSEEESEDPLRWALAHPQRVQKVLPTPQYRFWQGDGRVQKGQGTRNIYKQWVSSK